MHDMIKRTTLGEGYWHKIALTLMLAIPLLTLRAQQVKKLGLEEATQLALSHDLQLKIDSAQLGILNAKLLQAQQSQLPEIGLNLSYLRISDNITPFTVTFPTGDVTLNPQILNQSYNSLQLKQLIWSGGKTKYGIDIAKKELEAATYDIAKNKAVTVYNIAALWYNLYVLKNSQKILETTIKTLLQSQQDVKNFVQQGTALENEVLKIDLAVTNLQSNLINITHSIDALNFNLCTLTGLPTTTVLDLPELNETVQTEIIPLDSYLAAAINNRAELKTLKNFRDMATLNLKLSRLAYLPTISGIASGNYNLPEQRLFPNQNTFTPTWFVGLNVNWSISQFYKQPEKIKEAKQLVAKNTAMYNQLQEGIMMEINTAYANYLQGIQRIAVAKKAVVQATENFRIEQNKLTAAVITTTDFLAANDKLLQAKLDLSAANANAQLALKKLNKTIGQ
jgi:outer membrane protein